MVSLSGALLICSLFPARLPDVECRNAPVLLRVFSARPLLCWEVEGDRMKTTIVLALATSGLTKLGVTEVAELTYLAAAVS